MKKRIFSLLVALCLVVGLLPVIAMAEDASATVVFPYARNTSFKEATVNHDSVATYWKITTKTASGVGYVSGVTAGNKDEYHVKLLWPADSDTLEVYLNGAVAMNYNPNQSVMKIGKTTLNCNVKIIVESTSTLSVQRNGNATNLSYAIYSNTASDKTTTITTNGDAELIVNCQQPAATSDNLFGSMNYLGGVSSCGNLVFDNANVTVNYTIRKNDITFFGQYPYPAISAAGNVVVNGGNLTVNGALGTAIAVNASQTCSVPTKEAGDYKLEIKDNATVSLESTHEDGTVLVDGSFTIDTSTVTIKNTNSERVRLFGSTTGTLPTPYQEQKVDEETGEPVFDEVTGDPVMVTIDSYATTCYNRVDVQNATVELGVATDGSDASVVEVDGYQYPGYTGKNKNLYFHTTPITGGGSGDSGEGGETESIDVFANMQLEDSLGFNFFVKAEDVVGATNLHATIVHNGVSTENIRASDYKDAENNTDYKMFSYNGLTAKQMMETLTITIYDGETVLVEEYEDSVYNYICRKSLDTSLDEKWLNLFAATLNYGVAAQYQFNYEIDNKPSIPDDSKYADLQSANTHVQTIAAPDGTHKVSDYKHYVGMSLQWDNTIALAMFFDGLEDGMTAKFTVGGGSEILVDKITTITQVGTTYEGFYLPEDYINYDDAEKEIVVTVYDGETVYATASDSMESYLTRKDSDNNLAFWRFAECCKACF